MVVLNCLYDRFMYPRGDEVQGCFTDFRRSSFIESKDVLFDSNRNEVRILVRIKENHGIETTPLSSKRKVIVVADSPVRLFS